MLRLTVRYLGINNRILVCCGSSSLPSVQKVLISLPVQTLFDVLRQPFMWSDEDDYQPAVLDHLSINGTVEPGLRVAEDELVLVPHSSASDPISPEVAQLLHGIHDRLETLRKMGISLRTIREALMRYQHPSRLVVTFDYRITLTDFDNQEIPLTPLPKALYLLYLQHPEGIAFKSLSDYRDELLCLYTKFSPSINPQRREHHINNLIDPTHNSLNEKVSIIRRTFANYLDESLLPFYIISGGKADIRSIHLPHHLITMQF